MSHIWVIERLEGIDDEWRPFQYGVAIGSRDQARVWKKTNQEIWGDDKFRVKPYDRRDEIRPKFGIGR